MKIIIAPDKFKGSLSAKEVCAAIREGIHRVNPNVEVVLHPLADGGEGSLDILASHFNDTEIEAIVQDPLFRPIRAAYLKKENSAYIEMARASGLPLLKVSEYNCRLTTTYGTGQLIRNAIQRGARTISLYVGGSATNDGGIGMAAALGYRFLDKHGHWIKPIGENLQKIDRIDVTNILTELSAIKSSVVSDVRNPFYGKQGAAYVFAPQKGADADDVVFLDEGLHHLAEMIECDLGVQIADLPGAGAAGGLGGGGVAFLGATIESGIERFIDGTQLEAQFPGADLIITGEGLLDHQSLQGKVVAGVAQLAQLHSLPCLVIAGNTSLTPADYLPLGIGKVYTVMEAGLSLERAMREAKERVANLGARLMQEYVNR